MTTASSPALPTGAVTFLVTDVAGSTRLWEAEDGTAMHAALRRHYAILDDAVARHGGVRPEEQGEGDSIVAVFGRPSDALAAALAAQLDLVAEPWPTRAPLRVRMALHTGEAHLRDARNYAGQAIIRAARLRALGHGGQVLVSGTTRDLVLDEARDRFDLISLGQHSLRDLERVEHVWQLVHPDLPSGFAPLLSVEAAPRPSLPRPLTPFIGRQVEVDELAQLVQEERLVVVTGAGGAGKTRMAIEVGGRAGTTFGGGVRWVELAALGAEGVEPAVRAAFDISEGSSYPLAESVRRAVDGTPTLLVVDNCEHVAEPVGRLVEDLLGTCPQLHVLATSRVSLGAPGEYPWRVPTLAVPGPSTTALEDLSSFDALQLFCDRARRAHPNFELSDENCASVAAICRTLDGIPLAIELAAARCRILGPAQILHGLSDALGVLAGGSPALQPRQQTLEASIRWSTDLLSSSQRRLFERLSVFVDGWTLEAAEAVAGDEHLDRFEVFDALDRLVDQSLVTASDTGGGTRFTILETVRQFASRSLAATGEADLVRDRHAAHVATWLGGLAPRMVTPALEARFAELTAERGNILAAGAWMIERGACREALDLLTALFPIASTTDWVPVVDALAELLDPCADRLDDAQLPRLRWAQALRAGGRGDVAGLIERVIEAEQEASAVGDHVLQSQAAVMRLVMMGAGGADVVDDLTDEWHHVATLGRPDHTGWVAVCTEHTTLLQRGPRALGDIAASIDAEPLVLGPSPALLRFTTNAIASYLTGDARRAIELGTVSGRSPFTNALSRPSAILATALASIDLGTATLPAEVEVLRHRSRVDGSHLDEYCLLVIEATHAFAQDDVEGAAHLHARAVAVGEGVGMVTFAADLASALVASGVDAWLAGDRRGEVPVLDAARARFAAEVALRSGAPASAADHAHAALRLERAHGLWRGASTTLDTLARALISVGRPEDGVRLLGSTAAFRDDRGTVRPPALERRAATARAEAAEALGDERTRAAFDVGRTLSLEAAIDLVMRLHGSRPDQSVGWEALTPTESKVAELVAQGLTNAQVARELIMGAETVKTHLSRVFQKVGVGNRRELILAAARRDGAS